MVVLDLVSAAVARSLNLTAGMVGGGSSRIAGL